MASTGKTVIEATLALVAAAFGLAKTTTTITLIAACARNSGATGISVCKTTTIGTKPAGAATAATKVATTRRVMVVRATAVTAATAKAGVGTGIRKALLGLHAGNGFTLEKMVAVKLDVHDLAAITELGKRDSNAITPGAASAANAVGVVFCLHGQAKIEHVGDGGHINTTGRHIGCHQNLHLTLA